MGYFCGGKQLKANTAVDPRVNPIPIFELCRKAASFSYHNDPVTEMGKVNPLLGYVASSISGLICAYCQKVLSDGEHYWIFFADAVKDKSLKHDFYVHSGCIYKLVHDPLIIAHCALLGYPL